MGLRAICTKLSKARYSDPIITRDLYTMKSWIISEPSLKEQVFQGTEEDQNSGGRIVLTIVGFEQAK